MISLANFSDFLSFDIALIKTQLSPPLLGLVEGIVMTNPSLTLNDNVGKFSEYFFEMPSKNEFEPQRLYGNDIELIFYNLDSSDINYKILSFQNFLDNRFSTFYYTKKSDPKKGSQRFF